MLTERQDYLLRKVVEGHVQLSAPVASKWLAEQPGVEWGPSTVRAELAALEDQGLLDHRHTSAGREPTEAGYRLYVDSLLREDEPALHPLALDLSAMRQELDRAMQATTLALAQVTDLVALVSAPLESATVKHVEVLLLQPNVVMVVVITSSGGVGKRVFPFEAAVDPGLVDWAATYLNEELQGLGLGARRLRAKLSDPGLSPVEAGFLAVLAPVFSGIEDSPEEILYVEGAFRLLTEERFEDLGEINALMQMLERRYVLLGLLRDALEETRVYTRIGHEIEAPELQSASIVAANYGLAHRNLGTVSVIGPLRMDYSTAIGSVRDAAAELSRFVEEVYER